jgi:hypothetical protein
MIDTSNKEIQSHYDFIIVGAARPVRFLRRICQRPARKSSSSSREDLTTRRPS